MRNSRVAAAILATLVLSPPSVWGTASADHGAGIPVSAYATRTRDEAEIVRLIGTVAAGWESKNVDLILSAYALDAVQRAWNDPATMIGVGGIRGEALGAFA